MMMKMVNVILQHDELAEFYALRTLYDYVQKKAPVFKCFFEKRPGSYVPAKLYNGLLISEWTVNEFNNGISLYSDVSFIPDNQGQVPRNLNIDISILKNSVKPLTLEEKLKLRSKYKVDSSKPVLVLSYVDSEVLKHEFELLREVGNSANIILVGSLTKSALKNRDRQEVIDGLESLKQYSHIKCVTADGVLRDYYALADAAINCANLVWNNEDQMHNFVEATEGGPLFMVKPAITSQYGFKELVDAGAIRLYNKTGRLIEAVARHLRNFKGNGAHHIARSQHLIGSRAKYLPVLVDCMDYMFNDSVQFPKNFAGLETETFKTGKGKIFRVYHRDTYWEQED